MIEIFNAMELILLKVWDLIKAPVDFPGMLWIALPLILAMVLMELYFGRYKKEELGWNSAFANSMVLFFVGFDLIRHLYGTGEIGFNLRFIVVLILIFLGTTLTWLDFFHLLPKELAFILSAKFPTTISSYIAIVLVYSNLAIDLINVLAIFLFALLLFLFIKLIWLLVPEDLWYDEAEEEV